MTEQKYAICKPKNFKSILGKREEYGYRTSGLHNKKHIITISNDIDTFHISVYPHFYQDTIHWLEKKRVHSRTPIHVHRLGVQAMHYTRIFHFCIPIKDLVQFYLHVCTYSADAFKKDKIKSMLEKISQVNMEDFLTSQKPDDWEGKMRWENERCCDEISLETIQITNCVEKMASTLLHIFVPLNEKPIPYKRTSEVKYDPQIEISNEQIFDALMKNSKAFVQKLSEPYQKEFNLLTFEKPTSFQEIYTEFIRSNNLYNNSVLGKYMKIHQNSEIGSIFYTKFHLMEDTKKITAWIQNQSPNKNKVHKKKSKKHDKFRKRELLNF